MKGKYLSLSIFGVLLGRILNRVLGNYFGMKGPIAVVTTIAVVFLVLDLYFFVRRRYFAALVIFIFALPQFIGTIGMCIDNMFVLLCSILSIFIVYPLFIKWIKGLDYIDKSYLWKLKGRW